MISGQWTVRGALSDKPITQGVSGNEGIALALVTLDDLVERRKDTVGVVGDPSKFIVWMPVQGNFDILLSPICLTYES